MSTAAQMRRATGKMCAQFFCRSTSFQIAITIGESNYAIGISDVQELRLVTGRIKGDSKRLVQALLDECFDDVWFSAAFCIAERFDPIGTAFHDEEVTVGRSQ